MVERELEVAAPELAVAPFVVTRDVSAPRELVWRAHTEPEHLTKWFGPKGTVVLQSKMDLRVGGTHHYGLRAPDGNEMWGRQTFVEIVPIEKLVFLQSFSDKDGGLARHPASATWPLEMLAKTTFDELGPKRTRITVEWTPHGGSAEERSTFDGAREGMTAGFGGMFELLEAYLSSLVNEPA